MQMKLSGAISSRIYKVHTIISRVYKANSAGRSAGDHKLKGVGKRARDGFGIGDDRNLSTIESRPGVEGCRSAWKPSLSEDSKELRGTEQTRSNLLEGAVLKH